MSLLTALVRAATVFRTTECFVVTPGYWRELTAAYDDPVLNLASPLKMSGPITSMTVMGIPVAQTRGAWANVEFAEVHHRPDGLHPQDRKADVMAGIRWKGMRESRHYRLTDLPRAVPEGGPRKPAFHTACNQCGLCCVAEPCAIARIMIPGVRTTGPCPALEWKDGKSWCGMVTRPHFYSSLARASGETETEVSNAIQEDLGGLGSGCDSAPMDGPDIFRGLTAAEYLRGAW